MHTISVKLRTSAQHVHNFLSASTSKPHMRRRLCENSAVQRPALAFSQISTLRHGDAGEHNCVFRFIQSGWSAAKLRKHAESYALQKAHPHPKTAQLGSCYPIRSSGHSLRHIRVRSFCCRGLPRKSGASAHRTETVCRG